MTPTAMVLPVPAGPSRGRGPRCGRLATRGRSSPCPISELTRIKTGRATSLAVAVQPLIWAGIGRRYPWAVLGLEAQAKVGWGVIGITLVLFGYPIACFPRGDRRKAFGNAAICDVLLLVSPPVTAGFDVLSSRHFAQFGYRSARPLVALEGLVLVALVFWVRSSRTPGFGIALAAFGAFAHRVVAIGLFPLDERRSDMYAVLLRAVAVWRAGGHPTSSTFPELGWRWRHRFSSVSTRGFSGLSLSRHRARTRRAFQAGSQGPSRRRFSPSPSRCLCS